MPQTPLPAGRAASTLHLALALVVLQCSMACSTSDPDGNAADTTGAEDIVLIADSETPQDAAADSVAVQQDSAAAAADSAVGDAFALDAAGPDAVADAATDTGLAADTQGGTTVPDSETLGGWTFTRVLHTGMVPPGALAPLTAFGPDPILDDGAVVVRACTRPLIVPPIATETDAILRWDPAGVTVIAAAGDAMPSGKSRFVDFDRRPVNTPQSEDGTIVFTGNGADDARGMYRWQDGVMTKVIDRADEVPGTGVLANFFGEPRIGSGGHVALGISGAGVYVQPPGGALAYLIGPDATMPHSPGGFSGVGLYDFMPGFAVLAGNGPAPAGVDPANFPSGNPVLSGIYRHPLAGGATEVVVDKLVAIPGHDADFFVTVGPHVDGDTVVFYGGGAPDPGPLGPFGSVVYKGHFRATPASGGGYTIARVVDTDLVMPGGTETFSRDFANGLASHYLAADEGEVFFRGVGTTGDQQTRIGLYLHTGTEIVKVIDNLDRLGGLDLVDVTMGNYALETGVVTFWAQFDDGTEAIYVAERATP